LPSRLFANLTSLIYLNASYNVLRNWSVSIGHMQYLRYLDLSNNQLSEIKLSARNDIMEVLRNSKLQVNLTNNPFLCDCGTRDFLEWIYNYKNVFYRFEQYQCSLENNTKVFFHDLHTLLFPHLQKECGNFTGLLLGTIFAILLCLICIATGIIYRFRWKIRYLYYITKSRYLGYLTVRKNTDAKEYEYDAFISYANEDKQFIHLLIQKIENENNFQVCIHERDFLPGVPIADSITKAINNSRKTIVVLSKNYLNSYWCTFEFNMARMESIYSREDTNVLFLIFYENVEARDIPLYIMDVVNSDTYLEYPRDPEEGDIVFWNKIVHAITP